VSNPRFVIYKDRAGWWRWHLQDTNGKKIADSAESYVSESNCDRAARNVIAACRGNVEIVKA
jgi:uncharacterized protein YegP (UPF0339 family)